MFLNMNNSTGKTRGGGIINTTNKRSGITVVELKSTDYNYCYELTDRNLRTVYS